MNQLERLLAQRYLRVIKARGRGLYLVSGGLAAIALCAELVSLYLEHRHHAALSAMSSISSSPLIPTLVGWKSWLRNGSLILFVVAWLFQVLVALVRRLTIFSSISTYGLFIGSSALVVVLSIMSGFEQDLKAKILGANAHILVTSPDAPFSDYEKVAERMRQVRNVESVSPYLSNEVMISSQANLSGVILKGIDPASAATVTDLARNMREGKLDYLVHPEAAPVFMEPAVNPKETPDRGDILRDAKTNDTGDDSDENPDKPAPPPRPKKILPGVVIGQELQRNLRVFLGDEVNIISPMGDIGPAGPMPRSRPFRVVGIFYSGMYEYDTKHIYLAIGAAQKFLGMSDEVSGVEVRVQNPDDTAPVVAAIKQVIEPLKAPVTYEVQDWQELNRSLFSALKIEKVAMFIALCFIILVAGFAIIANGIMLVREKERQISMLKSMGATDRSILKTFLYIGVYTGLTGIGTGIATGIGCCLALRYYGLTLDTDVYYIAKLPVQMNPYEIASVFLAAMSIALLATLYPALIAARLRPVDGLRYDHG